MLLWFVGWFYGAFPVGFLVWYTAMAAGATKPVAGAVAGATIFAFAAAAIGVPYWTRRHNKGNPSSSDCPY